MGRKRIRPDGYWKEYSRRYYQEHIEERREYSRRYYQEHKEEINAKRRANPVKRNRTEYNRMREKTEKRKAWRREYQKNNREKINKQQRELYRKKKEQKAG